MCRVGVAGKDSYIHRNVLNIYNLIDLENKTKFPPKLEVDNHAKLR